MAPDPALRERLERRINELPVLPTVVSRLMTLDRDADGFFDEVLDLVESDPTFAARVLAAANSAASSPRSPIDSVRAALARLGGAGVSSMLLSVAVARVFVPRDEWEKSLWRHALQVAAAARELALTTRGCLDPDQAYTIALLHDIGRIVLFGEAPDALRRIDERSWNSPTELIGLELEICGLTHSELGQMACRQWGLPDHIGTVILHHHDRVDALDETVGRPLAAVRFADLIMFPSAMPGSEGYDRADIATIETDLLPAQPPVFGLDAEGLHQLIVRAADRAALATSALGLD